jgi:hypothetical protein
MKLLFGFANVPVDVEEERARIASESRHKAVGRRQNEGCRSAEAQPAPQPSTQAEGGHQE